MSEDSFVLLFPLFSKLRPLWLDKGQNLIGAPQVMQILINILVTLTPRCSFSANSD